jgi:hypothetical protein
LRPQSGICPERRREQDIAEAGETPRSFAENDPFGLDSQLSEDQNLVRGNARALAQGYLLARAGEDYLEERFDREIMTRMGRVSARSGDSARLSTPPPRAASHSNIPDPDCPLLLLTKFQAAGLPP